MHKQEKFIHLRIHSEFSLSCGTTKVDKLIKKCKTEKQPAVAITDQSNLCALIKFYTKAINAGIKPICGAEILVADGNNTHVSVIALCINEIGYKNLTQLISQAYVQNQQHGIPVVDKSWFKNLADGLIILSGGLKGDIGQAIIAKDQLQAEKLLQQWMDLFPNRFYLEIQRLGKQHENQYITKVIELALAYKCPVVATNDVMYLEEDEFIAHEAKTCITQGVVLQDPKRNREFTQEQYFKSTIQMQQLFADIPEAIANSVEIAKRCTVNIELGKNVLPEYPIPKGQTLDSFFRSITSAGLQARLANIATNNQTASNFDYTEYQKRLDFELNVIIQMGFQGYFLIVMDFIKWAKENSIPVGPGRGSGAGSLVAYSLGITDLDPLEYDLLFERFLNPERVSMPDFDIDFCMDKRDDVIDYVASKYGRHAVSQIITFGTMAAKAVVRDVARIQSKSYNIADKLSKMIPFEIGMTLTKAYEQEENIREFIATDDDAKEIWELSLKLEGLTRNFGKHAGGVVIAPNKITDFAPLYCDDKGHGLVTQFDKNDVESVGLVKFDFLGLRTLTIIDWAIKAINESKHANNEDLIDLNKIDIDDEKAFAELKKGETTGVFQLESRGMKDLIKRLLPDSLEDIIALVALFRPGPLQSGMVDNFINRKHKREAISYPDPQYQHELLKPILEPTYGIILYQEQVMQIAQVLAGYTLGGADMLRRAMGKKKPEEMAKQRQIFQDGASKKGIDPELAIKIFDLVEKFAGYGFNKSHSAAYGLISYQTLWLKTHYPEEFMAAVISSDMQNTDKVIALVAAIHSMGIKLVAPNINTSNYRFQANGNNEIIYGLGAIKGLGEGLITTIVNNRDTEGDFKDVFDFCNRIGNIINKRAMEALIFSGALDSLTCESEDPAMARAILTTNMPKALKASAQEEQRLSSGNGDLFGGALSSESFQNKYLEQKENIIPFNKLNLLNKEREALGLYFSGHPLEAYDHELINLNIKAIANLIPQQKTKKLIAGLITAIRFIRNKRNEKIAFVTISDKTGTIDVGVFSQILAKYQHLIKKDSVIAVEAEIAHDDYSGNLRSRANSIMSITDIRINFAKKIQLTLNYEQINDKIKMQLLEIFTNNSGKMPINIRVIKDNISGNWQVGEKYHINPSDDCINLLKEILPGNLTSVDY